jgi:hypothetical protein
MLFKKAMEGVPELRDVYRPGLKAMKGKHLDLIECDDTRRLAGSVDLDSTLEESLPDDPRWDYGIAVRITQGTDRVHWVEVHPAIEGDVKGLLKKQAWLKDWLRLHALDLFKMTALERGYVWIATKDIGFRKGSPKAKQLEARGISFPCRRFRIP